MRHVHRGRRRHRHQGVRHHHAPGPGSHHRDRGGPHARGAGGVRVRVRRRGRRAVRLLHPRHGHERRHAGAPQPRPLRGGGQVGHPRQHLPMHRLQEDHRGHSKGRGHPARRRAHGRCAGEGRGLRGGRARLPRGRAPQGAGLRQIPGRPHARGLPGHVLRERGALEVPARTRGEHRHVEGRGAAGRGGRPSRPRRARKPGGPPDPGLGRHDCGGRRHALRGRRHMPGGRRGRGDAREGEAPGEGGVRGAGARAQHCGGEGRRRAFGARQLQRVWQPRGASRQRVPEPSHYAWRREGRAGRVHARGDARL